MKTSLLSILAAATLALASCDGMSKSEAQTKDQPQEATADTAVVYRDGEGRGDAAGGASKDFDLTNSNLVERKYSEIKTTGVTVRGDDNYDVYSVEETVLFDTDKATVKPSAAEALREIVASIGQRYANKDVRVMGFADSRGDANYNYKLAQQRAEAVKNYLTQNSKMPADRVSTESFGEQQPAATNATASGRKENRRVEIAVRTK